MLIRRRSVLGGFFALIVPTAGSADAGLIALDRATSHSGRRTFITTSAHKGANVRVLAALAGHQ